MANTTTVQLEIKTKRELETLKLSERDTFNDVIENLIEDTMELSARTKKEIELALKEAKEGKVAAHKEAKKQLGL